MTLPIGKLLAATPFLCAAFVYAQEQSLRINAESSTVNFTLGANDHATKGSFHVEKGTIHFDRSAPKIGGLVVVAAGSGKTGNDNRDKKMTNEVLDAAHFAEVSFSPTSYQGTIAASGDSTIQVTGTFSLHGTPHELTVPTQIHIDGDKCTVKTHFVVPYVKWGLKDPSIFILKVAKEVDLDLLLMGTLTPSR